MINFVLASEVALRSRFNHSLAGTEPNPGEQGCVDDVGYGDGPSCAEHAILWHEDRTTDHRDRRLEQADDRLDAESPCRRDGVAQSVTDKAKGCAEGDQPEQLCQRGIFACIGDGQNQPAADRNDQ